LTDIEHQLRGGKPAGFGDRLEDAEEVQVRVRDRGKDGFFLRVPSMFGWYILYGIDVWITRRI